MVGYGDCCPLVISKSITFSKDTRHLGTQGSKTYKRALCYLREQYGAFIMCRTGQCRVSLFTVSLSNGTIFNPPLSLVDSESPAIITMYGSEINGSIFGKGHTQNAQERGYALRERLLFLLTTTACPNEKACSQCCW